MTYDVFPSRSNSSAVGAKGKLKIVLPVILKKDMEKEESRVTVKYQTTIPQKIRKHLGIKPGEKVEWHVVRGMVVVDVPRKVKNPVKFLTSQIKLDLDAVKLVREAREEFR